MKELPQGWVIAKLSDITEYLSRGKQPKYAKYSSLPVINQRAIQWSGIQEEYLKYVDPAQFDRWEAERFIQPGDILWNSTGRGTVGRACLVKQEDIEPPKVVDSHVTIIRPFKDVINPGFLFAWIRSEEAQNLVEKLATGATNQLELGRKAIASMEVPIAPVEEQEQIVCKLDNLIARVDVCRDRLARVKCILDRFRQSVITAGLSGQLTQEWRDNDSETPKENSQKVVGKLADFAHVIDPNPSHRYPSYVGGTIPLLATEQMVGLNDWDTESAKLVTSGFYKKRKSIHDFLNDDIIFARKGRLGLARNPPQDARYAFSHSVFIVRVKDDALMPSYLLWFLRQEWCVEWLSVEMNSNAGVPTLGKGIIEKLPVEFPSRDEQKEIVRCIKNLFDYADRIESHYQNILIQLEQVKTAVLARAFRGELVAQNTDDESASILLEKIRAEKIRIEAERKAKPATRHSIQKVSKPPMETPSDYLESLSSAFAQSEERDARQLFDQAGFHPEEVIAFYEALRQSSTVRRAFEQHRQQLPTQELQLGVHKLDKEKVEDGEFRLIDLWLEEFKNLVDYKVCFDDSYSIDIVLGWNGTGKSNLFESLVVIFRDLHEWSNGRAWNKNTLKGFRLRYKIYEKFVDVSWQPQEMRSPLLNIGLLEEEQREPKEVKKIAKSKLPLPRFVFGYYSGPTNRLAGHFLPMNQKHYNRLRDATSDDPETLSKLLEERRFFCAENHHAKYVLLAFFHKEDSAISHFLESRLRIVGFESALFVIRKPRWAKSSKAEDFWGTRGVMRRVMERLRRFSIAPMVLTQNVREGYSSQSEDHYYFFLPDLESLHAFAAEYQDARTFFLALESIDFSELIYDLKIQVRVQATKNEQVAITFHEMSEGEQQLLMVLGLMRFTKSHQSLVLLDEPDTHLNPHWSVDYLKLLSRVMSETDEESEEQKSSQILMSTHDPLVIASLLKEQIHLLKRDWKTDACTWEQPTVNPRGLGFTGILTSEMFGMRSDLDEETLADLDNKVRLVAKESSLTPEETKELEAINRRLEDAGFQKAFSDPYYAAFIRAWGERYSDLMEGNRFISPEQKEEIDRISREVLEEVLAELQAEATN